MINITEKQKKLIEAQGYMVVQFKLWYKKLGEVLIEYARRVIDTWKAILLFLQDMILKVYDSLEELAGKIVEEYRPIIDRFAPEHDYESHRKYPFVRSLCRKYEFNYHYRITIYHCRNNCKEKLCYQKNSLKS